MVVVVIMAVVIMVVVAMIMMMAVIVMRVVVVTMGVTGICVGAAFGVERRFDLDHARAEALHHGLDDVIPANAQGFRHDLGRQMAVAQMPADTNEVMRIAAADFQ